jgi:hypothetical protein
MKRKSLALLGALAMLLLVVGVQAEEVEPTGKFGEASKALREQNQEERRTLMEENKEARETLRETNKDERENLREENKDEREQFRIDAEASLEGKTPEEKAALMVTIKAERKALFNQNQTQKQEQRKAQWDSKKSVTENIRTNVDAFRETVRSRWTALWASFGKK